MGKGEIACYEQFLLFPQCFIPIWRVFCHFYQTWNCHLQTLSVWKSLKFVVWERVKEKDQYENAWLIGTQCLWWKWTVQQYQYFTHYSSQATGCFPTELFIYTMMSGEAEINLVAMNNFRNNAQQRENKRTMMVLHRSPEYKAVQVNNEDKYQIDYQSWIFQFQEQITRTDLVWLDP